MVVVAIVAGIAALVSFSKRTVEVKTGERVMCTYGEQVSNSIRTIRVPAKEAANYSVKTVTITCDEHLALEASYAAAQAALAKKDVATAKAELEKVVRVEPSFRRARQQLDEIAAGKVPAPDTGTGGGGAPPDTSQPATQTTPGKDDPPAGPVASLLVYTPDSLAGYRVLKPVADVFAVSREYLPLSSGKIAALVIAAEQHRSDQAAIDWVRDNVRQLYTHSARDLRVKGHDGYIATDGRRFAIIAWTEGPITVAIEADTSSRPQDVLSSLESIASAIAR